ncbi:hypothetical protein C802_02882 [Phocaeicola sartorii]|uniref:Uncharacterized protein n=1 Tax=Phocaeicola sartorii TaxID=671267 RepID=R9I6F1_9BACT|nr:hypothetical protein C802_02882 [Phocaeicola sartorii]
MFGICNESAGNNRRRVKQNFDYCDDEFYSLCRYLPDALELWLDYRLWRRQIDC